MIRRQVRRRHGFTLAAATVVAQLPLVAAAAATVPPRTVSGRLALPHGAPAAGAYLLVEPLQLRSLHAEHVGPVATGFADSSGHFALSFTPTALTREVGAQNGGVVNFMLHALYSEPTPVVDAEPGPSPQPTVNDQLGNADPPDVDADLFGANDAVDGLLFAAYAFAVQLVDLDNGDVNTAFTPVNVGLITLDGWTRMTVESLGVDTTGAGTTTEEYPPTESQQDGEPLADTPCGTTDATAYTCLPAPFLPSGTALDAPPDDDPPPQATETAGDLIDIRPQPPQHGGDDPAEYCATRNDGTYVEEFYKQAEFEPVGEVHTGPYMTAEYSYTQQAGTDLGVGVNYGKGWKISGDYKVRNTASSSGTLTKLGPKFYRQIDARFDYSYERVYLCGYGTYAGNDASYDRIVGKTWTGDVAPDGRNLAAYNERDDWNKALKEQRDGFVYRNARFTKDSGRGHKYTASATAFGITLSAQTEHSTTRRFTLVAGGSREYNHTFGNNGRPATAEVVYAYD